MDSLPPEGKELQLKVRLTSKRTSHRDSYLNASSHKRKSTSTIGTCSCVSCPSVENEYKLITKNESHDAVNIISNQNQSLRGQVMALPDNFELKSNEGNTYPQHGKLILEDKQSLERCSDEDKREKNISLLENEFVSTRNRMNSMRKVVMQGAQNLNGNVERGISLKIKEVTSASGEKQPPIARTALAEKTNVCSAEETTALHVPGKWKCPRKSKPHVGPPLKQLRLERWVRRVL
ncbi:hypothetical protein HPP92_022107 [Vanilla planifolia]|uniref:Uncharacterized protein n=1 Tax=Vanilla planifolia TaxID=51239 RepID=A0A835PMX2_VANPL|nr:hypothetical protein HPP92_022107 [Vanilla planifolia]